MNHELRTPLTPAGYRQACRRISQSPTGLLLAVETDIWSLLHEDAVSEAERRILAARWALVLAELMCRDVGRLNDDSLIDDRLASDIYLGLVGSDTLSEGDDRGGERSR